MLPVLCSQHTAPGRGGSLTRLRDPEGPQSSPWGSQPQAEKQLAAQHWCGQRMLLILLGVLSWHAVVGPSQLGIGDLPGDCQARL
jgi:hypothetical protein